jgi:porin
MAEAPAVFGALSGSGRLAAEAAGLEARGRTGSAATARHKLENRCRRPHGLGVRAVDARTLALAAALLGSGAIDARAQDGSWLEQETATGNWGGAGERLAAAGITPGASYTTDLVVNPVGGARQGFEYAGELEASLELDLERLLGLQGSSFFIAASWASGRDLSEKKTGNLFTVAQVFEGQSVRLAQMYFEQELLEERLSLAVGRLSTGDDFATSELYENYVNAGVNGNPLSISLNAESFSSDPVASWGLRAIALPARRFRLAAGFYNADPEVGEDNRNGVDFALDPQDGVLAIAEAGYRRNQEEGDTGLPGNLTVGGYYDSSDYESLDDPGDERRGSYGLYVLLDQMVYREDGAGSAEGLTPWAAFTFAPVERVNPLPFLAAAGLVYQGLLRGRADDTTNLGVLRQAQR